VPFIEGETSKSLTRAKSIRGIRSHNQRSLFHLGDDLPQLGASLLGKKAFAAVEVVQYARAVFRGVTSRSIFRRHSLSTSALNLLVGN
jgi:2-hydroxy-3-keto-5-methylthiopentenyl-1-phosphate phosphatase